MINTYLKKFKLSFKVIIRLLNPKWISRIADQLWLKLQDLHLSKKRQSANDSYFLYNWISPFFLFWLLFFKKKYRKGLWMQASVRETKGTLRDNLCSNLKNHLFILLFLIKNENFLCSKKIFFLSKYKEFE